MQYSKPSQEEMNEARYSGESRPNYEEIQRIPGNTVNGTQSQPYYMYHKDRYGEYR